MRSTSTAAAAMFLIFASAVGEAQTGVLTHNTNLRSTASAARAPIELLMAGDSVSLISTAQQAGYYHVRAIDGKHGWAWARNVRLTTREIATPPASTTPALDVAGSSSFKGCGDGLWKHVYKPSRLLIKQSCVTVTGVIVDATATQKTHHSDGTRHEADGDTHGWLSVDPQYRALLDAGNASNEGGNLVFEIVCHFSVSQADAKSACKGFTDHTTLPALGTHVTIRGTLVQDDNHAKWIEIHPVSSIQPD